MSVGVANRITPISPNLAASAMTSAYRKVTGQKPTAAVLGLLLGQWALETGNGKSVHNFNYGNKKSSSEDNLHTYFRCHEMVNGKKVYYDPPNPACKFSAYTDATSGAVAYIKLLKRRAHWWKGLHSGTPEGFTKGLATKPAFFTADPAKYEKILRNRMERYLDLAEKYGGAGTAGQVVLGVGLSAAMFWGFRHLKHRQ